MANVKPSLNPNLKDFWKTKARYRILHGGRSSSKSWDTAGVAINFASRAPLRFLCVRQFQNKISESVYTLLKSQINRFGYQGFDVQANRIFHSGGAEFVFYGIARNIDEIKSFEGADILWIEEAHNLTKEQWDILEPTIRKEGSQIWITFNPRLMSDFVYQRFVVKPYPNSIVRAINYDENPFISDTMQAVIDNAKAEDEENYNHIYLGRPLSDDDAVIIKRSWLDAAIDFHKNNVIDLKGAKCVGYDVADSGDDKNAVAVADGGVVTDCYEWQGGENELKKSTDKVRLEAAKVDAKIIYDSIGVGAHTGSTLQASGYNDFAGFNAGAKVIKPTKKYNGVKQREYFSNLKAQAWWLVADRLRNTHDYVVNGNKDYHSDDLISINGNIKALEQLIAELTTPRKDFDKAGRVKVESKDDLKNRGVMSPNLADSFIMALSVSLINNNRVSDLNVSGF